MRILFFGDIVGRIGRQAIKQILPKLKKEYQPDLILANVENLAHGKGITYDTIKEMKIAGIDMFTSGNHIFRKPNYKEVFDTKEFNVLRPANYPPNTPGQGFAVINVNNIKVAVINLMGRVFLNEPLDDPFRKLDEILNNLITPKQSKLATEQTYNLQLITVIDWHAEISSEKNAMGWHADGRVTAVIGTHTHVPTADCKILPKGTAYISDVGMVGARDSILGVIKEGPLAKMQGPISSKFEFPETGVVQINSVYLEIDEKTSKAKKIERVDREVKISE